MTPPIVGLPALTHAVLWALLVVAVAVALLVGVPCLVGRYLRWRGEAPEPRDRGGHVRLVYDQDREGGA